MLLGRVRRFKRLEESGRANVSVNAGFVIATVSSRSPMRNESKLAGGSGDSWVMSAGLSKAETSVLPISGDLV